MDKIDDMKYLDYKEDRKHGSFDFPFAFYSITAYHPRYHMLHHWHPEFELIRILDGTFTMQLDGMHLTGRRGDSFLITGGVVHSGIPKSCRYECVVFDLNFFLKEQRNSYRELLSIVCHERILNHYYPAQMTQENELFANICEALSRRDSGFELMVQGNFYHFFGLAFRKNLFQSNPELPDHLHKIKQFKSVISMIQQHYNDNLSLVDMAESVHMNPNYFCRFFKEITQQTPVQYLNYYRIESACEKLSASDKSITEIALECGFNDVSYFVKVFKKFKGMTPTKYSRRTL